MTKASKKDDLDMLDEAFEEEETKPETKVEETPTEAEDADAGNPGPEDGGTEEEEGDELTAALKAEENRPAPNLQTKREEPSGSSRSSSPYGDAGKKDDNKKPSEPSLGEKARKATKVAWNEAWKSEEVQSALTARAEMQAEREEALQTEREQRTAEEAERKTEKKRIETAKRDANLREQERSINETSRLRARANRTKESRLRAKIQEIERRNREEAKTRTQLNREAANMGRIRGWWHRNFGKPLGGGK